jgi:RNA polymerase sigma-70 factor (subfamily 1)
MTQSRKPGDAPRDGDPVQVEQLLSEHTATLRAFVRLRSGAMLRSMESTADIVQSVCREILQHRERFRHGDKDGFRQWLYTMAARKISNRVAYYRARKRDGQRVVPLESGEDAGDLLECYRSFCTPTGALRTREEVRRIEAAFESLPEHYREVITLTRIAGLPPAQVAERMNRTEGSTRMLLFRALARLAELLEEDASSPSS